jgi:hypothetical protein
MTTMLAYFTDAEVDEMCAGLTQNAAKIRYLKRLGLKVDRKPNGRPLAWRPVPLERPTVVADTVSDMAARLEVWAAGRKAAKRRGR